MERVIAERTFAEAVDLNDRAEATRFAACHARYGIRLLRSYLSRDRRRMLCIYEAPDVEAVRLASRAADFPYDTVWTANVIDHGQATYPPGMECVVVERAFDAAWAPTDSERYGEFEACAERHRVRPDCSYVRADGRRWICLFEGPDGESVRRTNQGASLPFERAWTAVVVEPAPKPDPVG